MSQELPWQEHSEKQIFSGAFWKELFTSVKIYTEDAVEHLILASVLYITVCVLLYLLVTRWRTLEFNRDVRNAGRVLIVIAHPDDECMFFGPTIHNFVRKRNCLIYLLCLSTGKNYGLDKVRKKELYESCKVLGIDESCIIVQSHTLLPDSLTEKWPAELVAKLILNQIEAYDIDTLITFDKHGVSKHLNHCSIYYAIAHLSIERILPKSCKVYVLESVNKLRKYWLILDMPLCFLLSRYRYILTCEERKVVFAAMKKHRSQLVWFRRLYLIFSTYTIINTLQQMDLTDIELDLEIDD